MEMNWEALAGILDAITWPLVVGIALVVFRKPLTKLAADLGSRVTKLSVGAYAIELAPLPELTPDWSTADFDVRQLTSSQVFDSFTQSLFEQLATPSPSDYAVIDLGQGKKWLSSRLYIFALLLERVSKLRALVFVEDRDGTARSYVGTARPDSVHLTLAKQYPWLEAAFIKAYAAIAPDPKLGREPFELSDLAASAPWQINQIVRQYVEEIQQKAPPSPEHRDEWESFGGPSDLTWERTQWLNGRLVDDLLGTGLNRESYRVTPDSDPQSKVTAILRRQGDSVAFIDEDGRFSHLVDRTAALEELASRAAWPS
jgi:hypothetical protein